MQFSCYAVYSSQNEINFRFSYPVYFLQGYDTLSLYSHEGSVYRKVKGKSRGSSKGHKVAHTSCAPLDHPNRDT